MKIWIVFENLQKDNSSEWYSAGRLSEEIEKAGHDPVLVSAGKLLATSSGEFYQEGVRLDRPDCVIARTGADTRLATYSLYRSLELMGVPVLNSTTSMELAANKIDSVNLLKEHGIASPAFVVASPRVGARDVLAVMPLPLVVKDPKGTCGTDVRLIETGEQFDAMRQSLLNCDHRHDEGLIFQEYISSSKGRDYRLIVVNGEVIASMERRSVNGDFRANASLGGTAEIYKPSDEAIEMAIRSASILGLDIAGVDILDGGDRGSLLCEVNSAPGGLKLEEVTGVNMFAAIVRHAQTFVEKGVFEAPSPYRLALA